MVTVLWNVFAVAISVRLALATGPAPIWESVAWGVAGVCLSILTIIRERRERREHEQEMAALRDKLTEQAGFNRGSAAALGTGLARVLELAGEKAPQAELRREIETLKHEAARTAVNQLTIVETI